MTLRDMVSGIGRFFGRSEHADAPGSQPSEIAGRELRELFLSTTASQIGLAPTEEYPAVFGVAMDWPVSGQIATIVALADGTASLYTTSSFGIIGGQGHESARRAAQRLVAAAQPHFAGAWPATGHPYPTANEVRFYLLGYDSVRAIYGRRDAVETGSDRLSGLFALAQEVLTALREAVPPR